jgi:hypothetical protein
MVILGSACIRLPARLSVLTRVRNIVAFWSTQAIWAKGIKMSGRQSVAAALAVGGCCWRCDAAWRCFRRVSLGRATTRRIFCRFLTLTAGSRNRMKGMPQSANPLRCAPLLCSNDVSIWRYVGIDAFQKASKS